MFRRLITMLAAVGLTVCAAEEARAAEGAGTTLTVATLAPRNSPWGTVFKAWAKGVEGKSGGAVKLQFYYGNEQGDEIAMVNKMRSGQLDGAAITATGLSQIYKSVLVLQLPGLYRDWDRLDAARNAMKPTLDKLFEEQHFKIVGWGDVGVAHLMTKGFEVRAPADLIGKKVFNLPNDPIEKTFYSLVDAPDPKMRLNPNPVPVTEILTSLTSGSINVVNAPSLAAEQLQWTSMLDHINVQASGIGIGALVFASAKINGLPEDMKKLVLESGKNAGDALTASIRNEDKKAFERLKTSMTAYEPSPAQQEEWKKLFKKTRDALKGKTLDAKLCERAEACANEPSSAACTTQ